MNEREKLLMEMILSQSSLTIQEAATIFGVTERTIRNSLDEIDDFLISHQFPSLTKKTITSITYPSDSQAVREKMVTELETKEVNRWLESSFREIFIFNEIALGEIRLTVDKLESMLQMSRSTVHNDIRKIKKSLVEEEITLEFNGKTGFYLTGKEINIRKRYLNNLNYFTSIRFNSNKIDDESREILQLYLHRLEELFKKELSYESFFKLMHYLNFSIIRIRNGHQISENELTLMTYDFEQIKRYSIILEKFFSIELSDSEIQLIIAYFQESRFVKDDLIDKGFQFKLNILAEEFIKEINQRLEMDLSFDDLFMKNLSMHFQTSLLKKQTAEQSLVSEEMLSQIKKENVEIYEKVKQSINMPGLLELRDLDEENIVLLTIHVVSRIEQLKKNVESNLNVLVICHMGTGTSQFLKFQLENYFSFKSVLGSVKDLERLKESSVSYELVLATVDLPENNENYLRISPYPTEVEIQQITTELDAIVKEKLQVDFRSQRKEDKSPMLKELLVDKTIETNVEAKNWEEAIRKSGNLLVNTQVVETEYVEQMIEAVHEFGPYIVVVPGIALAHASSKAGVNKIGMSLITLSNNGVEFGNKNNDPVFAVISLATIDHDTHLRALSELVQLLNDELFKQALKANDKKEILAIITNKKDTIEGMN